MCAADEMVKCQACRGRGYHRCRCWPGDCICGQDDRECDECDGTGWTWRDDDIDDLIERALLDGEDRRFLAEYDSTREPNA